MRGAHSVSESWCESCKQFCYPPIEGALTNLCQCCDARVRADERERLVRTYDGSAAYAAIADERDAAKARTVEWMDRYNAQVEAERQSMADLRAKVEGLPRSPGGRWNLVDMVPLADVLALLPEEKS